MSTNALLTEAMGQGLLSQASLSVLNVRNLGADIEAAMGIDATTFPVSDVVLIGTLIDDSSSIRFGGFSQAIRDGHNELIDDLSASAAKDDILIHARAMNKGLIYPFSPIGGAIKLDTHNYDPSGGTPLYDQSLALLGTMLAKTQEFDRNGVPCRTISVIITDGMNEHGSGTAADVANVVKDMLKSENHVIAAIGIGTYNFKQIFKDMGIPDEWILNPKDAKATRRALGMVSQKSQQLATTKGTGFSQSAAGGFGTP